MSVPALLPSIQAVTGGAIVTADTLDDLDKGPGAYVLLMDLAAPVLFSRKHIAAASLSGPLVYAGSARGGGGIRARLRRHFRRGKPVHWHVDELTNAARHLSAVAVPLGSECDLVDRLVDSGRFAFALPGFGASDCRRCTAHLLRPNTGHPGLIRSP